MPRQKPLSNNHSAFQRITVPGLEVQRTYQWPCRNTTIYLPGAFKAPLKPFTIIFCYLTVIMLPLLQVMGRSFFQDDTSAPQKSDGLRKKLSYCCFHRSRHWLFGIPVFTEARGDPRGSFQYLSRARQLHTSAIYFLFIQSGTRGCHVRAAGAASHPSDQENVVMKGGFKSADDQS